MADSTANPNLHDPLPSTTDPSVFWWGNDDILQLSQGSNVAVGRLLQPDGQRMYLRLMPVNATSKLNTEREALDLVNQSSLCPLADPRYNSRWDYRNQYGGIAIAIHGNMEVYGITQLHLNQELWGVDGYSLDKVRCLRFHADYAPGAPGADFGFIPSVLVEDVFNVALSSYLQFYRDQLKLPCPLRVIAGMTGIQGYKMGVKDSFDKFQGKMFCDSLEHEIDISNYDGVDKPASVMRPFYDYVWGVVALSGLM